MDLYIFITYALPVVHKKHQTYKHLFTLCQYPRVSTDSLLVTKYNVKCMFYLLSVFKPVYLQACLSLCVTIMQLWRSSETLEQMVLWCNHKRAGGRAFSARALTAECASVSAQLVLLEWQYDSMFCKRFVFICMAVSPKHCSLSI